MWGIASLNMSLKSIRLQLTAAGENLRLIEEHMLVVEVPLHMVKEERRLRERIAELEKTLCEQTQSNQWR